MQVAINPSAAVRSLQSFILESTGTKVQYAKVQEFFAEMCGFKEHRALAAEEAKQLAVKPVEASPQILNKAALDWEFHEDEEGALADGKVKRPYRITAESFEGNLQVQVLPEGISEQDCDGHPALFVWIEINGGVPMVTLSNQQSENLLSVFATGDGFLIRRETSEFVDVDDKLVPPGSDMERVIAEKAKFFNGTTCDGMMQLNPTYLDGYGLPIKIVQPASASVN